MTSKKDKKPWLENYEAPKLYSIAPEFQQALGITYCASGPDAGGGAGACDVGTGATGTPGEPNACSVGPGAAVGPGHGNSPCGPGFSAHA
ncbi:MAG: hypothetical protein JRC68_05925 [Deltaproteobacteria bacterium]|nr:hypothetical protein [Deltaproteobacteria bacterium]